MDGTGWFSLITLTKGIRDSDKHGYQDSTASGTQEPHEAEGQHHPRATDPYLGHYTHIRITFASPAG
jgi:hypothetical protein